ncbi:MAG: T9SS type A sorting domain-containing protein [Bacteroidales bacterium]|jgi:hypothetical protein|nr:T9SS type A sorting domain-containing protein [Bacteroidales bacterium]MCK9498726.1 T9SS type A sorting domain-containing protein [Bacteroidales bacterium]NLB85843.1 T9SS type A sorting domain-containing protein [Bacteroidales bacterium]
MRKAKIFLFLGIILCSINLFSQTYQLPNGGFELWDGNGASDEPSSWNSFPSADCNITIGCSSAIATRHEKSTDIRPGSSGNYSCKIYATKISLGFTSLIANGNMTTGQIRIGSTTATNSANYNITRTDNPSFSQKLNAKPDSIVFWAKFKCPSETQDARMSATIHNNYSYRDPETSDANAGSHVVGKAIKNFTRGNQNWKRYSIAFDYNYPANNPEYILLTFTTNKEAGQGSENDFLYLDDVEFIYNTQLSNISINGTTIPNFSPNIYDYYIDAECGSSNIVSANALSTNANISITQATNTNFAKITVNSGDKTSIYNIHFNFTTTSYITDEICVGSTYNNYGFDLPAQDIVGNFNFEKTIYQSETCDSIINLNLKVNPSYNTEIELMICENSTYNFYGQTLSEAGTYYHNLHSISGCDSIITLYLEVGSFYQTNINARICEGEVYSEHGFELDYPGIDTLFHIAQNNCDSLVILNLSVFPNFQINIQDTINQGEKYELNGFNLNIFEEAGDFDFEKNFFTEYGCDSIVILKIHVKPTIEDEQEDEEDNQDNDNNTEFSFNIYPIPAGESLTINSEKEIIAQLDYTVYDIFGRKTMSGKLANTKTIIDTSNLASGIYFIRITYPVNKTLTYKVLKN